MTGNFGKHKIAINYQEQALSLVTDLSFAIEPAFGTREDHPRSRTPFLEASQKQTERRKARLSWRHAPEKLACARDARASPGFASEKQKRGEDRRVFAQFENTMSVTEAIKYLPFPFLALSFFFCECRSAEPLLTASN